MDSRMDEQMTSETRDKYKRSRLLVAIRDERKRHNEEMENLLQQLEDLNLTDDYDIVEQDELDKSQKRNVFAGACTLGDDKKRPFPFGSTRNIPSLTCTVVKWYEDYIDRTISTVVQDIQNGLKKAAETKEAQLEIKTVQLSHVNECEGLMILPCLHASRLGEDIAEMMTALAETGVTERHAAVIIINKMERHVSAPAKLSKTGHDVPQIWDIFNVRYREGRLYDCPLNIETCNDLVQFLIDNSRK